MGIILCFLIYNQVSIKPRLIPEWAFAQLIEPQFPVEAAAVDDKRVALPRAGRIAVPRRGDVRVRGELPSVNEGLPPEVESLVNEEHHGPRL